MSGGHFNYIDSNLKMEIFGWADDPRKIPNVFEDREISELVWDVLNLIHDYDWYVCADTCKETYLKAKTEFKKKWFSNRGVPFARSFAPFKSDYCPNCGKPMRRMCEKCVYFSRCDKLTPLCGEGVDE